MPAADDTTTKSLTPALEYQVVQALHKPTGQLRALKRVFVRQGRAENTSTLQREYQSLQSISSPNVVDLLDHFQQVVLTLLLLHDNECGRGLDLMQGSSTVLVLEYCCSNLAEFVEFATSPFSEALVKAIVQQLLLAVDACHSAGILHRDIKPANILLSHDGHVKLADFGHARLEDPSDRPLYTHAVATRWYRAPELLYGARSYSRGVDLWAVGCVYAELLGMCPLVAGETDIDQLGRVIAVFGSMETAWPGVTELPDYGKISFEPCEGFPLSELLPEASPSAIRLLNRLLQIDPGARCSAREALADDWFHNGCLPASSSELCYAVKQTLATKQHWHAIAL